MNVQKEASDVMESANLTNSSNRNVLSEELFKDADVRIEMRCKYDSKRNV